MNKNSEQKIVLKPKKEKTNLINKITNLFADKKKRYLYMFLFMIPFLIAICVFGFVAYKEAKNLLSLATGTTEQNPDYQITSMNYVLRDNATDVQKEYFAELKQAIEVDNADNETIAGLVCKNFIADFYTWSNKQGQYDVGGMYYVIDIEESKTNLYIQARDEFYKYLSTYISQYGSENLLEVESVDVLSVKPLEDEYVCAINTHMYDENVGHYYTDVNYDFDGWYVTCKWTYKENDKFDSSKYATKMNFVVVDDNGRLEIVEASEKEINVRFETSQEETTAEEE